MRGPGAVGLAQQRDRQPVGVEDRVGLLLPALAAQRLLEVAVPVEQPDADDRHAEVAGGLEVVAGEDAEAAGVLRQHRGDAELGREVADRGRPVLHPVLVPAVLGEVRRQVALGGAELLAERRVGGQLVEPGLADGTEQLDRVAAGGLPQVGVDRGEDVLGRRVPGPPQVVGQVAQRGQRAREHGSDGETTDGAHPPDASVISLIVPSPGDPCVRPGHNACSTGLVWLIAGGCDMGTRPPVSSPRSLVSAPVPADAASWLRHRRRSARLRARHRRADATVRQLGG